MRTKTWVCFECLAAVSRSMDVAGEVPCPRCGRPCVYLSYKIPVPPKNRKREWSALREQLARERRERNLAANAAAIRCRHDLEQEIVRLEAMPSNEGRSRAIRLLRKRLS